MAFSLIASVALAGAEALPLEGDGYLVLRTSRNRFYGHPTLVSYLKSLGAQAKQAGLPKITGTYVMITGYHY